MNFVCIIPSRYASTRLPGKPLCDIAGKPMVQRVYEQAAKASKLTAVVVAVDNPKVYDTVVTFGGHAVMTREDHANGTDRLAEAVGHFPDADVIVNVQGDEPLIAPDVIDQKDEAMYFSRSLIPYPRHSFEEGGIQPYKHIGIYAYRRDFLLQYAVMEQTPAEKVESLEQLRVLENGYKIKVIKTHHQFIGIDTPDDLEHIRRYFAESAHKGE